MTVNLDDIVALSRTIGPRLSGGPFERRAGHYVVERLQEMAIPSTLLPVRTPHSYAPTYAVLFLTLAIVVPLARLSDIVALTLSLIALVVLMLEVSSRPVLSKYMAVGTSQNVLGLVAPRSLGVNDEPDRRVILSAHLDSGRSGLFWRAPLVHWFRPILLAVLASAVLIPLLLVIWMLSDSRVIWLTAFVPAGVLIAGALALLEREVRGQAVPGANDNASGVAVVLTVGDALRREPTTHVETWLLFTAGQEAGMVGMTRFLNENQFDPEKTYFIVLDTVGAGQVRYTESEGMLLPASSSPVLVRLASEIAERNPEWRVRAHSHRLLPTDQKPARAHGYQAISILAYDERDELPHWHEVSDTVEHIQLPTVQIAADLTLQMIRDLDDEVTAGITQRDFGRGSVSESERFDAL